MCKNKDVSLNFHSEFSHILNKRLIQGVVEGIHNAFYFINIYNSYRGENYEILFICL